MKQRSKGENKILPEAQIYEIYEQNPAVYIMCKDKQL